MNGRWRRRDVYCGSIAALLVTVAFSVSIAGATEPDRRPRESRAAKIGESKLAGIQQRIVTAVKRASPAVVRIEWEATEPTGRGGITNGVIVTADGYVVTRGQHDLPAGTAVRVCLADGRAVKGKALGSYLAWDIGMVRISHRGPWPHVELGQLAGARVGDVCIALGYRHPQSPTDAQQPSPRVVRILSLVASWSLCTSGQFFSGEQGDGLFDLDGRLIGIQSKIYVDKTFHPAIELVKKHWGDLIAGKQIDGLAPADSRKATYKSSQETTTERESAARDERVAEAVTKAKLATVRVAWGKKETDRVSGVIVTADGYVATCAHHERPPGEAITVYLADGRDVAGKVLGSIPFCDIGLMKITGKGPWPHVEFGSSMAMKRGDMSILVGYPFAPIEDRVLEPRRAPAVRLGFVVDGTSRGLWRLSTSCFNLSGDSGGGLFDLQGRLIGIHSGAEDYEGPAYHTRIEILQKQWDFLAAGKALDIVPSDSVDTITKEELRQLQWK